MKRGRHFKLWLLLAAVILALILLWFALPFVQTTFVERRLEREYSGASEGEIKLSLVAVREHDRPEHVVHAMWNLATEKDDPKIKRFAITSLEWLAHQRKAFVTGNKYSERDWDQALRALLEEKQMTRTRKALSGDETRILEALEASMDAQANEPSHTPTNGSDRATPSEK